jgi:hypothetical protein
MVQLDHVHRPDAQDDPLVAEQSLQYMLGSQGAVGCTLGHRHVQSILPVGAIEHDVYEHVPVGHPAPAYLLHSP